MESAPVPVIPEEFAKMLFTLNPDAFGGELENDTDEPCKQIGVKFQQIQKYETGFNRVSANVCL